MEKTQRLVHERRIVKYPFIAVTEIQSICQTHIIITKNVSKQEIFGKTLIEDLHERTHGCATAIKLARETGKQKFIVLPNLQNIYLLLLGIILCFNILYRSKFIYVT